MSTERAKLVDEEGAIPPGLVEMGLALRCPKCKGKCRVPPVGYEHMEDVPPHVPHEWCAVCLAGGMVPTDLGKQLISFVAKWSGRV